MSESVHFTTGDEDCARELFEQSVMDSPSLFGTDSKWGTTASTWDELPEDSFGRWGTKGYYRKWAKTKRLESDVEQYVNRASVCLDRGEMEDAATLSRLAEVTVSIVKTIKSSMR